MLTLLPICATLSLAPWSSITSRLPSVSANHPAIIDTVLTPSSAAPEGLTLFRERNGWCPYSEKVWLALELKGLEYSTVLIDNTGGGRPAWYSGQTPQVKWDDGTTMGESMDIVKRLDREYPDSRPLYPPEGASMSDVASMIRAFRGAFPSNAKPSSRAAYLFTYSGPLSRADFEKALDNTEVLLAKHKGPFFVGPSLSAADISWAPFLERYAAQLPCLHDGLMPRDGSRWPRLAAWYNAMDEVPEYACRVKGDGESWGRVLSMQGYGNMGNIPRTTGYLASSNGDYASLWNEYAAERTYVADSAAGEAAARIVRNRVAIAKDAMSRKLGCDGPASKAPLAESEVDEGLRAVALALLDGEADLDIKQAQLAMTLSAHLVGRMCVPRDMGVPAGCELRELARRLGGEELGDRADSKINKYD